MVVPMRMMFATMAAAVLLMAGCGADAPGSETTVTETVTVTAEPEEFDYDLEDDGAEEGEPVKKPASGIQMLAFGDTVELDGAAAVTVGVPEPVDIDAELWDFDESFDTFVKVSFTVENIGEEPIDTSDLIVQLLSGERAAETFNSSEENVDGDPYATVLPGKKVTFANGYAIGAGEELIMEVKGFLGDDKAFYQG